MSWKRFFFSFLLLSAILAGDALLKVYVRTHIFPIHLASPVYPYGGIGVIEGWHGIDFSIVHAANSGAAWGLFASLKEYLLYARILIIGALQDFNL